MNDRKSVSRGECLLNAVLWTCTTALVVVQALWVLSSHQLYDGKEILLEAVLVILNLASCGFHWRRYLAYDKKTNKSDHIV